MGNDIARQFSHLDAEEAAVQVGTHLEKFWDPRMRRRLRELLAPDGGHADEADPLLVGARPPAVDARGAGLSSTALHLLGSAPHDPENPSRRQPAQTYARRCHA